MPGTVVALTAAPDASSLFSGWAGDGDCADGSLTMSTSRTCVATFDPIPDVTLTVTKAGSGQGTLSSTPPGIACGQSCSATFTDGTTVALSGVPAADSVFAGWSGDADCSDGSVLLTAGRVCVATFERVGVVDYGSAPLDVDGDGRGDTIRYDALNGGATLSAENSSFTDTVLVPRTTHSWSPGWTIKTADFNGDGRTDVFFYGEDTGLWFKGISDGAFGFSYSAGRWSAGWSVAIVELNGDGRSDVFLFSPRTGAWFRGTSTGDGTGDFSYVGGSWSVGW